jgi:hypothetical protein
MKPPRFVQLKRSNGIAGAWHWVKLSEPTRTSIWLITGCGAGLYRNEVARATNAVNVVHESICGRCAVSQLAAQRRLAKRSRRRR